MSVFTEVNHPIEPVDHTNSQIRISYETEQDEWDAFLARTAGGHHVQTSLWAQVKAGLGWWAGRVILRRSGKILAGAQMENSLSKYAGWSGHYGTRRPNEVLDWEVIKWAKNCGYRYHDLEGINQEAAKAINQGEPLPESYRQTPTSYKLGFGGRVTRLPAGYIYFCNSIMNWSYKAALPVIANASVFQNVLTRLRTQ